MNLSPLMPSLYGHAASASQDESAAGGTLADMLHDSFYLLLLVKNRYFPNHPEHFAAQVQLLLENFERQARRKGALADDIHDVRYAICAAIDEAILMSDSPIRDVWERSPLQLLLFGDQLAGENFYVRLDAVRQRGAASLEALEVFYMCMLTGFQGKYLLEGKEKWDYLIATLDREIVHLKGKRAQFAPHWKSPDNIRNLVRTELPLWMLCTAFLLAGIGIYAGLDWYLMRHTNTALAGYFDLVKVAPRLASITISLP